VNSFFRVDVDFPCNSQVPSAPGRKRSRSLRSASQSMRDLGSSAAIFLRTDSRMFGKLLIVDADVKFAVFEYGSPNGEH